MGRRGPAPKPTALKKLEGTYRKDRAAPDELAPPPDVPVAPSWLSADARREWDRVVAVLAPLGVLTGVDGAMLEGYCSNFALAVSFQKLSDKRPMMKTAWGPKPNPAIAEARKHWALARQLAAEFGFTPATRSRVGAAPKKNEKDEVADFIFGAPRLVKP